MKSTNNKKRIGVILAIIAALLLIPFIAMQFTDEVNWNAFDFITAGFLLLLTGLLVELIIRRVGNRLLRLVLCAAAFIALCVIWAELAVGIFGIPFISGN